MPESVHLLPQTDRLWSRIEALEAPVVQLWGWPGSGKMAVLEAVLERLGSRAVALPLAAVSSQGALREALAAEEVRWFVASGEPSEQWLVEAERWLCPGQRLLFAGDRRRIDGAVPCDVVAPQELLLTADEVATFAHLFAGVDLAPGKAREVWQATDGWYRPLRLTLEALGGMELGEASPEEILEIPAVRLFLRHEVLDAFSEEERAILLEAPEERPATGGVGEDAWRLIDQRGLWIEGPERDRLPRLFDSALERERRRRRPARAVAAGTPAAPAPSDGRPVFTLGLLGSPIARQRDGGGERDLDCRLRRAFQVLAYLACAPNLQAGRAELIEAVWPTEGERTIERNFHPTMSHLRRALEGGHRAKDQPAPLLFRNGVYRLSPEVMWEIDVADFNRLVEEGRERAGRGDLEEAANDLRRAWRLYRGPFLQGYYEAWVASRREICQRLYLELLRELGDLCVRLGRAEEAMDAYRTILVEDPLQERIHLAVMRLYAEQGRRDLVRRQYDHLCRLLLEELGVPPMPETTRDYHRLMT
ncbi:MAG TPA: BTAD domain-containing putative transcriptional regulator [Thermoanaerobaculia bacterium]|jgi:DNA-binding SARP family transcriptional activator|nr:BTAD domain-containing putative transcriptional regulator [Thermoanaerobaculia bacterium]